MSMDGADRLRQARLAAGFEGPVEAAARYGWNVNTYKSNENGNASFSVKKAKSYASAFGVRWEWLYGGDGPATAEGSAPQQRSTAPPKSGDPVSLAELREYMSSKVEPAPKPPARFKTLDRRIPVVGTVAAGLWKEAPQRFEVEEWVPFEAPGYERAVLKGYKISGPSMNKVYAEGRTVVAAHPAEAGVREGDYVVVARHRADLIEITVKEFVREPDGRIALWPRSTHPDFQTPFYLKPRSEEDQAGIEIIGVVVGDFGTRTRPPVVFDPTR